MSRVGKKPIMVPQGVDVEIQGRLITVKGPKGELKEVLHPNIHADLGSGDGNREIHVSAHAVQDKNDLAQWGTARALIANMIEGVTRGFLKRLEVNGVGYRVSVQGRTLVLTVGFSHDVCVELPAGILVEVEGNTVTVSGASKYDVGLFADRIRRIRKPEPYKGKGIKYTDEIIRRKAGKAQKAAE